MDKKILPYLKVDNTGDATAVLERAAGVCDAMIEYLKVEQPYATESIDALQHTADTLRSCASFD